MKKILIIFILLFSFIFPISIFAVDCEIKSESFDNGWWDISTSLNSCLEWSSLVDWKDVKIESGFKDKISSWTARIGTVLWLLAVGSIVYWSILLTLNAWEEEKIKKAKDVVKWGIIGFIWVISASTVIAIVVNVMYSLD